MGCGDLIVRFVAQIIPFDQFLAALFPRVSGDELRGAHGIL